MATDDDQTGEVTTPYAAVVLLCEAFAQEQAGGSAPSIADYLERANAASRSTLLRNLVGLDIDSRRARGERPQIDDYISRFPGFADQIREAFLEAASLSTAGSQETVVPKVAATRLPVAGRRLGAYRLVGELGRGGMGVVYEAVHVATGNRVALKTLPVLDGEALHRFKREFRSLAGVNHPNLIGLQQLEADGEQWFFTMDLVEGTSFLNYVRPDDVLDKSRLRSALTQLAAAVMALHGHQTIHRDLKPSNVMVSVDGRRVVLDFGLVIELDTAGELSRNAIGIAGTPRYMAPEQAAGRTVTAASDWYAVGIMMYEALTGNVPFSGPVSQVMREKQTRDAAPIADPAVPGDLADLCLRLLTRDPASRADAREVVKVVAAQAGAAVAGTSATQPLVGREQQLAALHDSYRTLLHDREPLTVFVRGRSGEGKTALTDRFLGWVRAEKRSVVMAGRCYDRESVPFKALDTLIDALASYLISLPGEDAALVIPDDISVLVRVFPVLSRVGVVEKAADMRATSLDETQVRQRAFRALRSLLSRLSRRMPIVWFVDDLQWGDADSAEALFEVFRPPEAPTVLFVGTYRSDETEGSAFLAKWKELQHRHAVTFADREVGVGPLSDPECVELVMDLIGRETETIRGRALEFARETRGNPFLLTELAGCFDPDADSFEVIPLHEVLARKLERLPPDAGGLLDVIAVSGQALALDEAARTAGHDHAPMATVTRMRNERLVRLIGSEESPQVDTYHDRVRETIVGRMDEGRCQELHRTLAELIESDAGTNAESLAAEFARDDAGGDRPPVARVYDLAYHFDAAGVRRKAAVYALAGAEQARRQSALEVAVNNYDMARRNLDPLDRALRFRVAEGSAQILARLGRYKAANDELNFGSNLFDDPEKKARVEALLGEIALKQGMLQQAVACCETALRRLGCRVPRTSIGLAWGVLLQTIIQVWHSFWPGRLHRQAASPKADLTVRLLFRLSHALGFMNTLRMVWAHLTTLNMAELYPPSAHLSATFSLHHCVMALLGWHARGERYGFRAVELARRFNDDWLRGQACAYRGIGHVASADYEQGISTLTEAIAAFEKSGDPFEVHLAHFHKACCHFGLGDLATAVKEARLAFDSSARLGDSRVLCSSYLWARATRGNLPFADVSVCYPNRPDDVMSTVHGIMAEGHWHTFHGRTADALAAFDRAAGMVRTTGCVNSHMIVVLPELAAAIRRHAEATANPVQCRLLWKRAWRLTKWATRLSRLFPAIRPHALRERALILDVYGKTPKAWKCAAKSCTVAMSQKAKYELAQSLLVQGQLAKKLGRPEADELIRNAEAAIAEIERPMPEMEFSKRGL